MLTPHPRVIPDALYYMIECRRRCARSDAADDDDES